MSDEGRMLPECRMYESDLPRVNDLVIAEVVSMSSTGAECCLLEYNNVDAYLSIGEWSRKRIKNPQSFVRVHSRHVLQVVRVDNEKNYIDVSRKNVTPSETEQHLSHFKKSSMVHNILQRVSQESETELLELYTNFCWPLYRQDAHPLDQFSQFVKQPSTLDLSQLSEKASNVFSRLVKHRLYVPPARVEGKVKVMCHGVAGIDGIKHALLAGKSVSPNIQITVESCPIYVVSCKCDEESESLELVRQAMSAIRKRVAKMDGGHFEIAADPQ